MKKYILYPGNVKSSSDGDWHYVSTIDLANLYGVNINECIVALCPKDTCGLHGNDFIHLFPRSDGNYKKVS